MGKARDYIPALKYGHKIRPEDIAGMLGLPYVGNIYYVDKNSGDDDANSGTSQNDAFATVAAAYAVATAGQHDVIIEAPTDSGTGRTTETAAITWSKDRVHLIGSTAPAPLNPRAGMSFGANIATGLTVSADGCIFKSITIATFSDNNGLVEVSGSRNVFDNVHFIGIGHADAGDDTAARVLYLNGGQENRFIDCAFGVDTVMRSTTNATVEFASAASRNIFEGCRFIMAADNVGPNHVLFTGTSAIDRWVEFNNCVWYAFWTNDADKVTHCFDLSAQTATGHVLMTGHHILVGFDDWEASDSGNMYFMPYTATSNVYGIGINPAVS